MPRNQLSQRYNNADLLLENEHFDAEFRRLFWNPFADKHGQIVTLPFKRKRKRKQLHLAARGKHRCTLCPAVFQWPAGLRYHLAYQHRGEQLNVCPVPSCGLNFQFPYQLAKHQRTVGHHDWQVVCKECSKRFGHHRFLARHTVASCTRYKLERAERRSYDDNVAT